MKHYLIDTNVIIDMLLDREDAEFNLDKFITDSVTFQLISIIGVRRCL